MKKKFLSVFSDAYTNAGFSKMTISSPFDKQGELKSVSIKPFESKNGKLLSWVFKYSRKDITKNYTLNESLSILEETIGFKFSQADMFCLDKDYFLKTDGKEKLTIKESTVKREIKTEHNRIKNRIVEQDAAFLKLLGVSSEDGHLRKDKKDKFIQINKFLEFFSVATQSLDLSNEISVLDMGSGKGYLTFAIYDFLAKKVGGDKVKVSGVEFRQDMVDLCNSLASKASFSGLHFEQGTIEGYNFLQNDVLIALHACDTATDEALFKAITSDTKVIMVSPCCHKQVRKSMESTGVLAGLSKFGIMKERTAEMLTDLIRAAILEVYGYQTNIFEFVNSDHTPKNLMITAVKKKESEALNKEAWKEVEELKSSFGIEYHHLQKMLNA